MKTNIPSNYIKAKEVKPMMEYILSTRPNNSRFIAHTYGVNEEYTSMIDRKLKEGILYVKK